jgi:hypothetical protein
LHHLAQVQSGARRVLLLSRSGHVAAANLPLWAQLTAAAAAAGGGAATVEVLRCAVHHPGEVAAFVRAHAATLRGVVHAAGVLHDALLPSQTWEAFEAVRSPAP